MPPFYPRTDETKPSPKSATYTGALASTNAIKTSIATVAGPVVYSGGQLNGTIGAGAMHATVVSPPARNVTVTTAVHAASYTIGGGANAITITGTYLGAVQTDTLALTLVNGGETIVGTKPFDTVTQISIPAQVDTLGAFTFGVQDLFLDRGGRALRVTTAGNVKMKYEDASTDIVPFLDGERTELAAIRIFGDASTTAQGLTILF